MSLLSRLTISNFRNLESVDISPAPGVNLLVGDNGSGKTSLLEAISVLAHGRSFRTRKFRLLIQDMFSSFTLFAKVLEGGTDDHTELPLGVTRDRRGDSVFRLDGGRVKTSMELASTLPLLTINSQSFLLLDGPAKGRRQFFDWLVFHVKQDFGECWKSFSKCLKQRNSLLRRDKIAYADIEPWDIEFCRLSRKIRSLRKDCFGEYYDQFEKVKSNFNFGSEEEIQLEYHHGWKEGDSMDVQLKNNFERDVRVGFTTLGPHKSELKITVGNKNTPAADRLSRGQQKLLISALFLVEALIYQEKMGRKPVFLLDDMPAELDGTRLRILAEWINKLGSQVFITGITKSALTKHWPEFKEQQTKTFHVKHGEVFSLQDNC